MIDQFSLGRAHWMHAPSRNGGASFNRVFVPVGNGSKHTWGLVIEADGSHAYKLTGREKLRPIGTLTKRQVRGRFRKMRPASKRARVLRDMLLEGV